MGNMGNWPRDFHEARCRAYTLTLASLVPLPPGEGEEQRITLSPHEGDALLAPLPEGEGSAREARAGEGVSASTRERILLPQ